MTPDVLDAVLTLGLIVTPDVLDAVVITRLVCSMFVLRTTVAVGVVIPNVLTPVVLAFPLTVTVVSVLLLGGVKLRVVVTLGDVVHGSTLQQHSRCPLNVAAHVAVAPDAAT